MVPSGTLKGNTAFLIVATIGAVFLALAMFVGGREAAFVLRASKAVATFDGALLHSGGNHGGSFYYPQFRFLTGSGQSTLMTSKIGSTDQPYDDKQKVLVLYDPEKPTDAVLDHFWLLWGPTAVLGLITLLFGAIAWGIRPPASDS